MVVYVVVKEGCYRHEVIGAFATPAQARAAAEEAQALETDDYHTWEVLRFLVGERVEDGQNACYWNKGVWRQLEKSTWTRTEGPPVKGLPWDERRVEGEALPHFLPCGHSKWFARSDRIDKDSWGPYYCKLCGQPAKETP